jgi:hypothetical protein
MRTSMLATALLFSLVGEQVLGQQAPLVPLPPPPTVSAADQMLADSLASVVRDAIPLEYSRKKEWGTTKRITVGITTDDPIYELKLHRRKKHVPHGTWKQYRVTMVEPEKRLNVAVTNLHALAGGGIGMRLLVDADVAGWAQMRNYNRGVHLLTLTAEGTSQLRLAVDCEVRMAMTAKGMALDPKVTAAHLDLRDFELQRFGEIEGALAEELGDGLKMVMQDQLDGPALAEKLNRAIDKKRDRLVVSAADLMPSWGFSLPAPATAKTETP